MNHLIKSGQTSHIPSPPSPSSSPKPPNQAYPFLPLTTVRTAYTSQPSNPAPTSRQFYSPTCSEFSSQQSSSPVHPLNLSQSLQAVARALEARSKKEGSTSRHAYKNYSSQIDEAMKQLNTNCDLVGATNSASTSALNASGSDKAKKKGTDVGLMKKSSSQLSLSDTKNQLGLRKKNEITSFNVHRSEEVLPNKEHHLVKQHSSDDLNGNTSVDGMSTNMRQQTNNGGGGSEINFSTFVKGFGPGQIVGRQALACSSLGDIQLSLQIKSGTLDVEVIRARGLVAKSGARIFPTPYVKVYLIKNNKVIQKCKTVTARRTLDPLFQQILQFTDNFKGCSLHVMVWGNYGRMDKKTFMGVVQIVLDDLNLNTPVMGWYKLFNASSFLNLPSNSKNSSTYTINIPNCASSIYNLFVCMD